MRLDDCRPGARSSAGPRRSRVEPRSRHRGQLDPFAAGTLLEEFGRFAVEAFDDASLLESAVAVIRALARADGAALARVTAGRPVLIASSGSGVAFRLDQMWASAARRLGAGRVAGVRLVSGPGTCDAVVIPAIAERELAACLYLEWNVAGEDSPRPDPRRAAWLAVCQRVLADLARDREGAGGARRRAGECRSARAPLVARRRV